MKKWGYLLLVVLLLTQLAVPATAEPFDDRFDVELLYAYSIAEDTPAYDLTLFSSEETETFEDWQYLTYDGSMQYDFSSGTLAGYVDLSFVISGSKSDFGVPFLCLEGWSDQKFSARLLQLLIGDRVYWLDLKRYTDGFLLEPDGADGYDFDLILPLGNPGIALLRDLHDADFAFSLRLYDARKLCFAIEQPAVTEADGGYPVFYEGLVRSRFLDDNGQVQESIATSVAVLDGDSLMPAITVYPSGEKVWLPDGASGIPKPGKSVKPLEDVLWTPRLHLESTFSGDWGRVKTVPWIRIELKNTDKQRAMQSVTFVYYCTDRSGTPIASTLTGEVYNEMTLEDSIRAGKKKMLSKYSLEGYGEDARVIFTAIREVRYDDGTVETVSDRDLDFWRWDVK